MESIKESYAIQGEIIGEGIKKNIYGLKEFEWRIFDVFDIYQQKYLLPKERYKVLEKLDLLKYHVPILGTIKLKDFKEKYIPRSYSDEFA